MALVSVGELWALGAALSTFAGRRHPRWADDAPLHLALGACVFGLLGSLWVAAGVPLISRPFHLLVLFAVAAAALVLRRRRGKETSAKAKRAALPPATLALLAGAGVVWIAVVAACFQDRLWWDGWQNWAFKARVLFSTGTMSPAFLNPAGPYTPANLDYPLLAPLMDWWAFVHVEAPASEAASLVGAVWAGALALLVWAGLRDRVDTRVAAAAALGTAAFWPVAFFAIGGTADVLIATALVGAAVELERAVRSLDDARSTWRAAVFLALGALSKNEGIALAALGAVIGIAVLTVRGERRVGRLLPLIVAPLVAAPWFLHTRGMGLAAGASHAAAATSFGDRLGVVGFALGQLLGSPIWLPVPFLIACGLIAVFRRRDAAAGTAWALVLGYALLIVAAYTLTAGDIVTLVLTSSTRVFGAMVPALVVLAVLSAGGPARAEAGGR